MNDSIEGKDSGESTTSTETTETSTENSEVSAFEEDAQTESRSGKISLGGKDSQDFSSTENENAGTESTDGKTESGEKTSDYPAQSRVNIDGELYRTDDNGDIHMYYDKENKQWCMMPNAEYESHGYKYKTDADGNIVHAEGKLRLSDERKSLNDKVEGIEEGDDRGHIIADRFDASNHRDNLVPQLSEVNRGEYKKLENQLADAAAEGKDVRASYNLEYSENSKRPDFIKVDYSIDNECFSKKFDNRRNQ